MKELIPLFSNIKQPAYVWYADKPPRLGSTPIKLQPNELNTLIKSNFVYAENIFVDKQTAINLAATHSQDYMRSLVLDLLGKGISEKLIICHMNEEVGHGVFARENIQLGEMLAFYAGELKLSKTNITDQSSAYSLDVDTFTGRGQHCIDASDLGGIARFFQHLPLNPDELAQSLIATFRQNPSKLVDYIRRTAFTGEFTKREQEQIIQNFKDNITYGHGEMVKDMLTYSSGPETQKKDWQFERLRFHNITPNHAASANLEVDSIIIDNKPIIFFWASRDIKAGEQLGFDYGLGYWSHLNKLPLLFDKLGRMIARENYNYTEMPLTIKTTQGERCFFYNQLMYSKDTITQSPIKFSAFAQPVSYFWVRKKLANNNVVSKINLPTVELNSFACNLKDILPGSFKIELYEHDPQTNNIQQRYIYNVTCKTSVNADWKSAYKLLKESCISVHCDFHESTQEILIKGVNIYTTEMYQFIKNNLDKSLCTLTRL